MLWLPGCAGPGVVTEATVEQIGLPTYFEGKS